MKFPKAGLEVEAVKPTHKAPCTSCEEIPEQYRLKVSKGGGRFKKTVIYCSSCGSSFIHLLQKKLESLDTRLNHVRENYQTDKPIKSGKSLL